MISARLRRVLVDGTELPRRLLWGGNLGYRSRPVSAPPIIAVEDPVAPPRPPSPQADEVGIVEREGGRPSPVGAAARFLGLRVESATHPRGLMLVNQAVGERWPLIAASPEALTDPTGAYPPSVAAYVVRGGTIYLDGLDERSNPALRRLSETLGVALPEVRKVPPA